MTKTYEFNKFVFGSTFEREVQKSGITICLSGIHTSGNVSYIVFKAELSPEEVLILNALVEAHDPTTPIDELPQEFNIMEVPKHSIGKVDNTYIERSLNKDISLEDDVISWKVPYGIALLGGDFHASENMVGDHFSVEIHFAENDIVGQLMETTVIGATSIKAGWADNTVWKSYYISIMRPNGTVLKLGECIEVQGNEIILSDEITEEIPAGSYIMSFAVPLPYIYINTHPMNIVIGNATHRATFIPKGSTFLVKYHNSTPGTTKKVSMIAEYYV